MADTPRLTIAAISTPPGTGGIAVIRVSGPQAIEAVDSIWQGRKLSDVPARTATLGHLIDPAEGQPLDQVLATVFRAPHSFTGEDTVEISVHGSTWLQQEALHILTSLPGVRLAEPGEFTRRAFMAGNVDLPQAEAIADLIAAQSKAAARLALNQLRGNLSDTVNTLRTRLLELAALLELELDFSDQDVEFADRTQLTSLCRQALDEVSRLLASFRSGQAIMNGVPIAIVGPTNAGKSSLLNALVGDNRVIVSDMHGTTRDVVTDTLQLGDHLLRLADTAGTRQTDDPIENLGIERSRREAQRAHILLIVTDATTTTGNPVDLIPDPAPPHTILVLNKTDLLPGPALPSDATPFDAIVPLSAKTGEGLSSLKTAITDILVREIPPSDTVVITNVRHAEMLRQAKDALERTLQTLEDPYVTTDIAALELRTATDALSALTGQISAPEILSTVFSRFCIGK